MRLTMRSRLSWSLLALGGTVIRDQFLSFCHPEQSEGPVDCAGVGKVHWFFASLRMTKSDTRKEEAFILRSLSHSFSFDSPLVHLALKNSLHVDAGRMDLISIELAYFNQVLDFGNCYLCRRCHHGIKIARRFAIHEVSHAVALPGFHESEVRF